MGKLNPLVKPTSKLDTERLAGGSGALAAKQSNVALLRRAVLANLLWEDVAYMDGLKVAEEIKRLIPLCPALDVYNIAPVSLYTSPSPRDRTRSRMPSSA